MLKGKSKVNQEIKTQTDRFCHKIKQNQSSAAAHTKSNILSFHRP